MWVTMHVPQAPAEAKHVEKVDLDEYERVVALLRRAEQELELARGGAEATKRVAPRRPAAPEKGPPRGGRDATNAGLRSEKPPLPPQKHARRAQVRGADAPSSHQAHGAPRNVSFNSAGDGGRRTTTSSPPATSSGPGPSPS